MKKYFLILIFCFVSILLKGQTHRDLLDKKPKDEKGVKNSSGTGINLQQIKNYQEQIKRKDAEIDTLSSKIKLLQLDSSSKSTEISFLKKRLEAANLTKSSLENELSVTKDHVSFLKQENDSLKIENNSFREELDSIICLMLTPIEIPKRTKIFINNKPFKYREEIYEVFFDKNNIPIVNEDMNRKLKYLVQGIILNQDLKIRLVGRIQKQEKFWSATTDNNVVFSKIDYPEKLKKYIISKYNIESNKIEIKISSEFSENKVSIQITD